MPYVQRNWKGEITGLFNAPQLQPDGTCLTEPEPLPDDHPEVQAFRKAYYVPPEMLKSLTPDEIARLECDHDALLKEHESIRKAIQTFNQEFAELELALSSLLYTTLNISNSMIAHAIYFSPTSFEARTDIVKNAIIQLAAENPKLADMIPIWERMSRKLDQSRKLRNAIAHGSAITFAVGGRNYARYSAPAFDIVRVGRGLSKGQKPGLGSNDIDQGIRRLRAVLACIDSVNRLIQAFHDGDPSLPEKYRLLKTQLTALGGHSYNRSS